MTFGSLPQVENTPGLLGPQRWADVASKLTSAPIPAPTISPAQVNDEVLPYRLPPRKAAQPSNGWNESPEGTATSAATSVNKGYDKIRRTLNGARIDPPIEGITVPEVERIKKMHLCNKHFLLLTCTYKKCENRHDYVLKGNEKDALRRVARMAVCKYGRECSDPDCIYGHHCVQPEAKVGTKNGKSKFPDIQGKGCIYGDNCVFVSLPPMFNPVSHYKYDMEGWEVSLYAAKQFEHDNLSTEQYTRH